MTFKQMEKIAELIKLGYKVLGLLSDAIGGPVLLEAPDGEKYKVEADSTVVLVSKTTVAIKTLDEKE